MIKLKFFTDESLNYLKWPYLLLKIKKYLRKKNLSRFREIIIDPGVYELRNSPFYSWENEIDIEEFLNSLPKNHYFSLDYPPDMNQNYEKLFIQKSWENALKYHKYEQYICTVQYKFNNYMDFINWFDRYNSLNIRSGILGIGNMLRHRKLNEFLKHSLDYAFSHSMHSRMHLYGLCKQAIPYAYKLARRFKIEISIDQQKWQYFKKATLRPQLFKIYLIDLMDEGVLIA
ncbi:MAG: hypothetical protein ACTSRZ_19595 [Promethearchaeota archaeon]